MSRLPCGLDCVPSEHRRDVLLELAHVGVHAVRPHHLASQICWTVTSSPVLRLRLFQRCLDRLALGFVEARLCFLSLQLFLEEPVLVLKQHESGVLEEVWILVLAVVLHKRG